MISRVEFTYIMRDTNNAPLYANGIGYEIGIFDCPYCHHAKYTFKAIPKNAVGIICENCENDSKISPENWQVYPVDLALFLMHVPLSLSEGSRAN